ncbi:hypothetical protein CHARACLAT_004510 [Characodon lateralis]|uniref:Uncharacterized protein n=1 Tax=Characodon lateralis TaxID=208331 RepID=A0ABU7CUS6_9TELE|nr:hypothetical protein [Characodon lateralis]
MFNANLYPTHQKMIPANASIHRLFIPVGCPGGWRLSPVASGQEMEWIPDKSPSVGLVFKTAFNASNVSRARGGLAAVNLYVG